MRSGIASSWSSPTHHYLIYIPRRRPSNHEAFYHTTHSRLLRLDHDICVTSASTRDVTLFVSFYRPEKLTPNPALLGSILNLITWSSLDVKMIRSGSGRRRSSRSLSNLSSGAWHPGLLLILHRRRDHQLTSSRAIPEKGWLQFKRSRSISSSPNLQLPGHRIRIRKHQRPELACSSWILRRIKKSDFTHRRICYTCLSDL